MDITIPGYTLLRTLGKGGMATVYLAQQDLLERRVALKVMSRNLAEDPAFGARFMREAKIVSQLVHPNIVTVHEVGQHDGCFYLSMEYIDGHDLRTVRKTFDLNGKIRVIEDIARALHYAGEKGYVHRDIKPENIMFRERDGSAVLTDFGIAKAVKNDLTMTQTGTAIGTPHYMSPEQAKGKDVDHRSDLYSLGAVFFLLLSGRVPYDGESAVSIGVKHLTDPVPTLPSQYAALQPVIDGLMAKDPDDRFQSGLVLLNHLRNVDLYALEGDVDFIDEQPTIAAELPTDFLESLNPKDDPRFTLEFDAVEVVVERPPRTILPVFFASLFVVCSVMFFVYMARPAGLEKYIVVFERHSAQAYQWAALRTEQGVVVVSDSAKALKQEAEKTLGQIEHSSEGLESVESGVSAERISSSGEADSRVDGVVAVDEPVSPDSVGVQDSNERSIADKQFKALDDATEAIVVEEFAPLPSVDIPTLDTLKARIELLRDKYRHDRDVEPDFIAAHFDLLEFYPEESAALDSLAHIREEKRALLLDAAERGDEAFVERKLGAYKEVFRKDLGAGFNEFEGQLGTQLRISSLLTKALQSEKNNQLFTPKSSNAVAFYKQVLKLDASNNTAVEHLNGIAERVVHDAEQALRKGELEYAQTLVKRALAAMPGNSNARALDAQIKRESDKKNKLARALADAKKYSELGYLYTPDGANAYDAYKRVLQLAPDNAEAHAGLNTLLDKLSVQVWDLVGEAKFDEAKEKLGRPLLLMPNNKRLRAMLAAVEDVAIEQ